MRFITVAIAVLALAAMVACSNYDQTAAASSAETSTVQTSSFAIATETTASAPPAATPTADQSVLRVPAQTSTAVASQSPSEPTDTFPPRVSMTEAQKMLDAGRAVIVDVRSREDYAAEHVKGAISIPLSEVVARMAELPKDKTIITYCT